MTLRSLQNKQMMLVNNDLLYVGNPIKYKMDVDITLQEIVDQNELEINLQSTFEFPSYVMGFHVYKDGWTPLKGETLNAILEPSNIKDKFAVAVIKGDRLVGHLPLEKSGRFAKTIHYFLKTNVLNRCSVEITGKGVNQGDGKGMKVPCKLYFSADDNCINILKEQLPKTL